LATGVPADAATRSGRALALQAVGVALARADGIAADRIIVGAYPAWLADEPAAHARILGEVAVRQALFGDHIIRFDDGDDPSGFAPGGMAAWPFVTAAAIARIGREAVVMRGGGHPDRRRAAEEARAAANVAVELASVSPPAALQGVAVEHAQAVVQAALATLEALADQGWRAVVGDGPASEPEGGRPRSLGGDAVAERTETFD